MSEKWVGDLKGVSLKDKRMYGGSNLLWSELHSAQKSVLYISSNSKRCGPQETVVSLCSQLGGCLEWRCF